MKISDGQLQFGGIGSVPEDRYAFDPLGRELGFESAGPLAVMTRDQLHPPFVDDEEVWKSGQRWYEGAIRHTRRAAELCRLTVGARVVDIGSGLGGPARTLVDDFGVEVVAVNLVESQLVTMIDINQREQAWQAHIFPVLADANERLPISRADCVWSMNMLYHLFDHDAFISNARQVLSPGSILMVDDWMFTDRSDSDARNVMAHHFGSNNLVTLRGLLGLFETHDFQVIDVIDCGAIARTHMTAHFRSTFDRDFRPALVELDATFGVTTADDFGAAIDATIELYSDERLTYLQIAAQAI